MQTLKIGLTNKEGKIISFLTDREVIEKLYITFDSNKVRENYFKFHIKFPRGKNKEIKTHSFKENNQIVLSIKLDNENHVQYLIEKGLDLEELLDVPENVIPFKFKKLIANALLLS